MTDNGTARSGGEWAAGHCIQTVLGRVDPAALGVTQCHEHLLIDLSPIVPGYDAILYDERLAVEELGPFRAAGGRAIVELTNGGIGRDPAGLRRIAAQSGVDVIMGTGWYREPTYPREVFERSTAELAELIVRDLVEGVDVAPTDETGLAEPNGVASTEARVRAGVIGEIGTGRGFISPAEERVLRAAGRAQRHTGAALFTHTTHFGELALEQLALLAEEGVPASRVVISHLGDRRGVETLLPIAATGAYLSIDNVGFREYQSDEQRAANVEALIREGFLSRIVLSTDICALSHLHAYGGKGYDHLLRVFLPLLRARGVTEAQIETMLVENPRRILAMPAGGALAAGHTKERSHQPRR